MPSDTPSPEKRVRDLMSAQVKTLTRNDEVLSADTLMRSERIRHVPILNESGELTGILSQRDLFLSGLLRALGHGTAARDRTLGAMLVKEVMTSDVVTTTPETPIREAAQVMVDRKIGCLPVLDGGRLVGLLSESDIVSAVARGAL
ncbi:MAG: CBS domain-containing protein [Acidobacteria bacterium]|nr:CBS domain-containing protein [Acidobacteriota bacterium]